MTLETTLFFYPAEDDFNYTRLKKKFHFGVSLKHFDKGSTHWKLFCKNSKTFLNKYSISLGSEDKFTLRDWIVYHRCILFNHLELEI